MNKREDQPLRASIKNGVLSISIGIETLKFSAENGPEIAEELGEAPKVFDAFQFAKDVALEMDREEEDGTTMVHLLLDKAIVAACENGSAALAPG